MNQRIQLNPARAIARAHFIAGLRVPFVHQGNTLQGIDCVATLAFILDYVDPLPAYPRDPVNNELETNLTKVLGEPLFRFSPARRLSDPQLLKPCDILSLQYAGPARHVAFVVPHAGIPGELSLVHTDSNVGCSVEHRLDEKWLRRVMEVWRL